MKNVIFLLTTILATAPVAAQSVESNPESYQAYLTGDQAKAKERWKDVVATAQQAFDNEPKNQELQFNLALVQFGLLSSTMRYQDEEFFDAYLDAAIENLEAIKTVHGAEVKALLASTYGLQLAYSPWKGIFLGPKSSSLMEKALKEDPSSPLIWKLYGNSKYHTPEAYGGSVDEAIRAYEKAIQLYETDQVKKQNNWFYIDAMAFLGQAYTRKQQSSKAVVVYEKAMETEPSFSWIKYSLLPAAKKKIQQ
jgi:tetratricopeptide (TPR) repeat protein